MKLTESTSGTGRRCRGLVDGANKFFAAQNVVRPGTLNVYRNGVLQNEGSDYIVEWEVIGRIETVFTPTTFDIITLTYEALGVD